MESSLFCIAVYEENDLFVVRKGCDRGYRYHVLPPAGNKLPQCKCEIVASKLSKEEAMHFASELSKQLDVPIGFID